MKKKKIVRHRASAAYRLPQEVLRVSAEPFSYLTEAQVHRALTARPAEYARFVESNLRAIAKGDARLTLPPKQVFPDAATGGDFRIMPCEVRRGGKITKTIKVIGTNTLQRVVRDQITVGKLLVLDPAENYVSAVMEACLLSSARTGCCCALAIDALARRRNTMVVIGSGRVGLYSALYATAFARVRSVVFCDVVSRRATRAARWLASAMPGVRCEARKLDAIAAADIVVIATTSRAPVVSPPARGADLVVSLGADIDTQSELDPAWTRASDLYCDTPDSLRFGDLKTWIRSRRIRPGQVRDLLSMYRRPLRPTGRPRVFISTGSALFDNLTARYLLERGPR